MSAAAWETLKGPSVGEDMGWELFHENSRVSHLEPFLPDTLAEFYVRQMPESLQFESFPEVPLPVPPAIVTTSLTEAIANRCVTSNLEPCAVTLDVAATLLHHAYGALGGEPAETERGRRAVHSSGSLFPLEMFVYSARVQGLAPGIYHYDPLGNRLRFLRAGDQSQRIAPALVDGRLPQTAALMVFIAAMPERSVLRYGDRGYRFVLLEAGAVVQNLNLAAAAIGLACANIGEFFDRRIDDVLNLDGLTISTLYVVAIGRPAEPEAARAGRETHHP